MAQTHGAPAPSPSHSALITVADRIDDLKNSQHALLGLEALIEPPFGADAKLLKIDRAHLWALIAAVNTRLMLDLSAAETAATTALEGARAC